MTGFADVGADAQAVAVQPDGKIVVVGFTRLSHYALDRVLVRYTVTGKLDPSFGRGGRVVTVDQEGETASAVAIQPDGKIVVAGRSGNHLALLRYTTRGTLDPSFGSGGKVVPDLPFLDVEYQLALQRDGRIVAAGTGGEEYLRTSDFADADFLVARFTSNGTVDTSFGSGGVAQTNFGGDDELTAIAIQPDGKIVAAGSSDDDFALARYTAAGKPDTTFGRGGKVSTRGADGAFALAIQTDGKIIAAGTFAFHDFALLRYTMRGRLDATFGAGGKVVTNLGADDEGAWAVAIQNDGRIVAAGDSRGDFALVRYTTAGKRDPTFGKGGQVLNRFGGADSVSGLALQKDGKIVAAGSSNSGDDRGNFALARYTK